MGAPLPHNWPAIRIADLRISLQLKAAFLGVDRPLKQDIFSLRGACSFKTFQPSAATEG
jgi:hypothetical protein